MNSVIEIFFSGLCFAWLLLAVCVFYLHRQIRLQFNQLKSEFTRLKKENKVIFAGAIGVGQRIIDLEKSINEITFKQDKQKTKQLIPSAHSYTQAKKLASMGATLEDIMESCALSKAEAELVLVLQRKHHHNESQEEIEESIFK